MANVGPLLVGDTVGAGPRPTDASLPLAATEQACVHAFSSGLSMFLSCCFLSVVSTCVSKASDVSDSERCARMMKSI
jgi:hypothetical protein